MPWKQQAVPVLVPPGRRLMSHISCFLEMLVWPRLRETGWRRMIPLSMGGVMERWRLRSICVHSLLSQHLDGDEGTGGQWEAEPVRRRLTAA